MPYGFTDEQTKSIKDILEKYSEIESAIIFGSRAMNTFKVGSDVDLALKGNISLSTISVLKSAFEESTLPHFFDVLDYETIQEPKLKEHIGQYGKVFYVNGWQETQLGNVVDITSSKRIFHSEYQKEGIPFYRSKEIIEKQKGNDVSTELFISEDKFYEIKNKFGSPEFGDLLLTSVGTLGIPYLIKKNEQFYFKDGNLTWFKSFQGLNQKYFYYWILSDLGKESLQSITIGSTQSALTIVGLKSINLNIPYLSEQKAIAEVLSSFDDKIELLRKQNKTLEAIAEALFKEYCLKDTSKGVPDNWQISNLSEIAYFLNGLALQKYPPKNENDELPVIKIKELKAGITNQTDKASKDVKNKYIVNDGDILFSWSGSLELVVWDHGKGALNQHLFKVTSEKYPKWFYYFWIKKHLAHFRMIASTKATTMGHIQRYHLDEAKVLIPEDAFLTEINGKINPVFTKIIKSKIQIQTLLRLRDTLLPKLMRGEVRVGA